MRDVSHKPTTLRRARAGAVLTASEATLEAVLEGRVPKGNPLEIAKAAAVMAAKKTTEWIPYCHNIPIEFVGVQYRLEEGRIEIEVAVTSIAKTGVEMEAMTAAAAAALTIYDMLKMLDEDMEILSVRLLEKTGGKSDVASVRPWRAGVLTVSDRADAGTMEDLAGPILSEGLQEWGAESVDSALCPDEVDVIGSHVRAWSDAGVDLVLITGGTGVGPRDRTPEAVLPLLDLRLEGIEETFRRYGQDRIRTAMLSRTVAGVCGKTVVVALPGSPSSCEDALWAIFPGVLHTFDMLGGGGH